MKRAEVVATVVLPLLLGALVFVPLPRSTRESTDTSQPMRVYAWSCGGLDAHEAPALVIRLPAAPSPGVE